MSVNETERLQEEILRLRALVAEQALIIEQLRSEISELKARLGMDSSNSSLPPSRDRTDRRAQRAQQRAKRQAEVKAAGRKPGKQPGAPGATLCRRSADRTVVHHPSVCSDCGASLAEAPVVGVYTRQVLEIPKPRLEAIDHVVQSRRCTCGLKTTAIFPPQVTGPVCWGPRARAMGAYLLGRQRSSGAPSGQASRTSCSGWVGPGHESGAVGCQVGLTAG